MISRKDGVLRVCLRCTHQWLSRMGAKKPKACPRCKSYRWDDLPALYNGKSIESRIKLLNERKAKHG